MKKYLAIVAVVAVSVLVLTATALSGGKSKLPTLKGSVGPGYTISLTKGGKRFTSLKAGTYNFVINDRSKFHNFTLEREHPAKPKLEYHITLTGFTGPKTKTITLKPGSWRYYCSVHEKMMHHDFTVKR